MTPDEPEWLEFDALVLLHALTIDHDGGLRGVRDEGALRSAFARPLNK